MPLVLTFGCPCERLGSLADADKHLVHQGEVTHLHERNARERSRRMVPVLSRPESHDESGAFAHWHEFPGPDRVALRPHEGSLGID